MLSRSLHVGIPQRKSTEIDPLQRNGSLEVDIVSPDRADELKLDHFSQSIELDLNLQNDLHYLIQYLEVSVRRKTQHYLGSDIFMSPNERAPASGLQDRVS